MKRAFVFSLFLSSACSYIIYQHSSVFDEEDFKVATLNITTCPSGCNLYLSYNKDLYLELAQKIYLQNPANPDVRWTFAELDDYRDPINPPKEGEKGYLPTGVITLMHRYICLTRLLRILRRNDGDVAEEVTAQPRNANNWPVFKIVNENENARTFPVLVYMAQRGSVNLNSAEVYDARTMKRGTKPVASSVVTIMNIDQFTLKVATDGNTKLSVFSRGFDVANFQVPDDDCTLLYRQIWMGTMPGVSFAVNGPLITLLFEMPNYPDTARYNVQIESAITKNNELYIELDQPNFVTSAGYLGCTVGEMFHSSDYSSADNEKFHFVADKIADSTITKNARFDVHFDNQNVDNSGYLQIMDPASEASEIISKPTDETLTFNNTREVVVLHFKEDMPSTFFIRSYPDKNDIAPVDPITPSPTKPTTLTTHIPSGSPTSASSPPTTSPSHESSTDPQTTSDGLSTTTKSTRSFEITSFLISICFYFIRI